jgi:hypothetical protein
MEEEIVGIYDEDGQGYICDCPICGNTVHIEEYADDETIDMITDNEVVEIYCDKCDSYFEAQLS